MKNLYKPMYQRSIRNIATISNKESLYKFRAVNSREERFKNKILRTSMILFILRSKLENEIDKRLLHILRVGIQRTIEFLKFEDAW
jgi:hypothetical protein